MIGIIKKEGRDDYMVIVTDDASQVFLLQGELPRAQLEQLRNEIDKTLDAEEAER